jgi:hypothetical protein
MRRSSVWLRVPLALASLAAAGCPALKEQPPPPFEVAIRVDSDPGHPLPGAIIMKGGKEGPSTGADGRVAVKIPGIEGESVDLTVKCPPDYVSPTKPINVMLRRIAGTKLVEYDVTCPPMLRRMVVAVRADNGPNLPVMYLGKELIRTDATGAATLLFQLRPGEQFELGFDTSEKGNERIRPQNPAQNFVMRSNDDVVTLDQKFTWLPKPSHYIAPPPKPKEIKPKRVFGL